MADTDDPWDDALNLALLPLCLTFTFLSLSHHTMNRVIWYTHAPDSLRKSKFWMVWIPVNISIAVCLYLVIVNINEFSRPSDDVIYGAWVITGMIMFTSLMIKMFPFVAFMVDKKVEVKDNTTKYLDYTESERLNILMKSDIKPDKYFYSNTRLFILMKFYSIAVAFVSIATLVVIAVNFTNTKSNIAVVVLWSVVTFFCIVAVFYILKQFRVPSSRRGSSKVTPLTTKSKKDNDKQEEDSS